ncbi:hypothetical protein GCM10012275_28490 [Longimycelium tulufanense]|uniref:Uncharacterized protein n=1 Tax=Longimycelium tulufanense TaxID=907463 RepID=A0A8J3FU56_9PSEU|nr:hypothetical protein GCM10012275_28490 [Longimycelium tulufanense]
MKDWRVHLLHPRDGDVCRVWVSVGMVADVLTPPQARELALRLSETADRAEDEVLGS